MTPDSRGLIAALAERYTIERELGAGGMVTVYLAHDVRHDRDVALKAPDGARRNDVRGVLDNPGSTTHALRAAAVSGLIA